MHTKTVIHIISENYRVIEHQLTDNNEIVEVFFKVSDSNNHEFIDDKFNELSEAISFINNLTFNQ